MSIENLRKKLQGREEELAARAKDITDRAEMEAFLKANAVDMTAEEAFELRQFYKLQQTTDCDELNDDELMLVAGGKKDTCNERCPMMYMQ